MACIHAYKHTCAHAYIHTAIPTYLHVYIPICLHAYMPTYLHTYVPTCYIPTYLHATYLHTYLPTYLYACTHACHACIHAYFLNYTYIGMYPLVPRGCQHVSGTLAKSSGFCCVHASRVQAGRASVPVEQKQGRFWGGLNRNLTLFESRKCASRPVHPSARLPVPVTVHSHACTRSTRTPQRVHGGSGPIRVVFYNLLDPMCVMLPSPGSQRARGPERFGRELG